MMDETTRWVFVVMGLAIAAAGVYTHRATIPQFVTTPRSADAKRTQKQRPAYVRHLATAVVIAGLLVVLAAIVRWQAKQGIPPQPLTIGTDASSIGLGMGSLMLVLIVLQLRTRKGLNIDGEGALALKQQIDTWLRSAVPGTVDGGSRLPSVVYRNEALEWTLLVVDDAGSWKKERLTAELACAAATIAGPQARDLTWNPIGATGALSAEPRWNMALKDLGTQEATLAITPPASATTLRLTVEVKSIFNLNARQVALAGVLASAIGIGLTAIGVFA